MKQENAIILGIGAVAAGIFGYMYYKKKQDEKAALTPDKPKTPTDGVNVQSTGLTDFQKKVMSLQTKLGIASDGSAGPQTNGTVKNWFPTLYAKLGNVSPSNVDQYLAAKREDLSLTQRLELVWNAMGSGTPAIVLKDISVPAYYYDSASKLYKPTGGYFKVLQGTKLYKSTSTKTSLGLIAELSVYDQRRNSLGKRAVLIKSTEVYVP